MSSISNKSRGKMPWLPLYTADLITDSAVCRCSFETRGVWVWMLCAAWKEKVRGTLPGDMDQLAGVTLVPIQILSSAVKDLEIHGVFSRGRDEEFVGHDLPPDAIVNRRMYGDFVKEQKLSAAGRKGGLASANSKAEKKRKNAPPKRISATNDTSTIQRRRPQRKSNDSPSQKTAGNTAPEQDIQDAGPNDSPTIHPTDTQSSLSLRVQRSTIKCKNAEAFRSNPPGEIQGEPVPISSVPISDALGGLRPNNLLARIAAVTGEQDPRWMSWFEAALEVMAGFGGTQAAEDIVKKAEDCADPIIRKAKGIGELHSPGKFICDRFFEWGRDSRNTMPSKPAAKGKS